MSDNQRPPNAPPYEECERRIASAIFGHVNMLVSGLLDAFGDPSLIGITLKYGLKRQFPLLTKLHNLKYPETLEEAVEVINKFGHYCKLKRVEPKEDAPEHVKIAAVFEDVQEDKTFVERAAENFGAKTNISECVFLLLSRIVNSDKYDYVLRTFEGEDGFIHARVYVIEKRFF